MARYDGAARVSSSKHSVISTSSASSSSTVRPDKNNQIPHTNSGPPRPPRAQRPPVIPARSGAKSASTTQPPAPEGPTPAVLIATHYRRDRHAQRSVLASPGTPRGEDVPPPLDEQTAIEGLHRLLQFALTTVTEIEPEMLQAADGDLQVAAPALGLLWASLRIRTKPPVVLLPTADSDNNFASFFPTALKASHARGPLLTVETCPLSLKPLFQLWCNIVPRVQALSPRLQSEVARIICDLDPLECPLIPQVMRLAADLRNAAIELSARRGFLDRLEADLRVAFAGITTGRDSGSHSEAESVFDDADAESSGGRVFTDTDEPDRESIQSSLGSSPSSKPLALLPVEVGPLDFDVDEVVRHASLRIHGFHEPQDYGVKNGPPPSEPRQYATRSESNPVSQGTEIPLRRLPVLIPPLHRDEGAELAQLVGFESASSRNYNPQQIPQLSLPPELTPISHSAPASPSAGSLMLAFWNTNTGHGINDGHAPTYTSPPSFGQAAPLLNASLGVIPPLRRTSEVNPNDPNQLFNTRPGPLAKVASQRTRGPRPLPPKPVPHDAHQQSNALLFNPSPAITPPDFRHVAPSAVEQTPLVHQASQRRPLPTLLRPTVPVLPSRHGGVMEPGPVKSASYATTSFSSTAPGSFRYGPSSDWSWRPPPSVGSTSQTRGAEPQASQLQHTHAPKVGSSSEAKSKTEYYDIIGHRPRQRSLTSIVDRSKGAVSVASSTEPAGGNYGTVKTTDSLPSSNAPQADREPRTPSPRRPPEDLPTPIQYPSNGKPIFRDSIGFALAYQCNPIAASSYAGASSSGSAYAPPSPPRPTTSPPVQDQEEPVAPRPLPESPPKNVVSQDDVSHDTEMIAIREMFYGAVADALSTPALRKVLVKDPSRAYFSAVSLAILSVATDTQMPSEYTLQLPGSAIQVRLGTLPPAYRACMAELGAIGREARKMGEEDDDRAIAYVARGKPLREPRMGRVRKLLERGVGYVDAQGRVRGSSSSGGQGTGRSRLFANRINTLSLDIVKLPGFHQRQEVFRILQGSR